MFRVLLYIFLIYLGYQFIFNFLVPVYKTTQRVRRGLREMHDRNAQHSPPDDRSSFSKNDPSNGTKSTVGEYIDFEDVK